MSLQQLKNVNFGAKRSGLTGSFGVSYKVLDVGGSLVAGPTTTGIYEVASMSGIYAANVSFPDDFNGQLLWTCPSFTSSSGLILSQSFASEQFNVEENDPKTALTWEMVTQISGTTAQLYDIQYGRWQILNNQMVFYREDNSTVIASFNLFDDNGVPTMDAVFDRQKV